MDILTSSTSEGKFKKQECAGLAARALRQLAAYEEGVTALSDKLKKFLGTRIVEPADKSFFCHLLRKLIKLSLPQLEDLRRWFLRKVVTCCILRKRLL